MTSPSADPTAAPIPAALNPTASTPAASISAASIPAAPFPADSGFEIIARHGEKARAGVLTTPHGQIQTPAFIPVGTKATVKAVLPESMSDLGAQALLANAYHRGEP